MLEGVLKAVPLILQGARTNFYGWGCPVYCAEPSWASLALTFLLGLICGLILASAGCWFLWTCLPPPSNLSAPVAAPGNPSPPVDRHSALAGYLDAKQLQRRR